MKYARADKYGFKAMKAGETLRFNLKSKKWDYQAIRNAALYYKGLGVKGAKVGDFYEVTKNV